VLELRKHNSAKGRLIAVLRGWIDLPFEEQLVVVALVTGGMLLALT